MSALLRLAACVAPRDPEPPPVLAAAPEAPGCSPLLDPSPRRVPRATPLEAAAAWSRHVDAVGAYGHKVALVDAPLRAVWTHDSANMRFTARTVASDGEVLRVQLLDPPTMTPGVLAVAPDGTVVAGGTVLLGDGPALTAMGPDGAVRWHQGTPRVGVNRVVPLPDGSWAFLGNSGRDSVTLGDTTHEHTPNWLGQGMDVVGALDAEGRYRWSKAFHPGALDLAVHDGNLFLAAHFGAHGWVDYGGGPVVGNGVLARLRAEDGAHVWTRTFEAGLYGVFPWGDDAVLVSAVGLVRDGEQIYRRHRLHAVGVDGCDRGSIYLGDLSQMRLGLDGALLAYGLRTGDPPFLGAEPIDVPPLHWWIARITPDLEVDWVHTVACDSVEVAGGPYGEAAVSCSRDRAAGGGTVLHWVPAET